MKIAFNPSTVAALIAPPNNKDITFDLRGRNIFARGVKFQGTDTWRDIKINNVSIGSNILDLRNGSNTTLTNTNGVVTINSTWRPVVDNLTSDSTTSSLSAKQGKVLAGLINGKSDSDHNHDDRYVKKSGDTMSGVLTIDTTNFGALTIKRNDDANGASIQFRGKSSVYGYIGLNNSTKDKLFLRWNSDTSKTYTILDTSSTYTSNGKGIINGTTITQVDNATNSTNSTNARKLVNWYSARPTSLNTQFGDGSLRIFHATSSTTEGKPAEDSHILHLAWDTNGGYDALLAVHIRSGKVSTRAQHSGTWQPWKTLAFTTDIPSSLKNPHALTISLNGTSQGPYDGSAAKNINITPSSIGAATSEHNHDNRYLKLTGGTMQLGKGLKFHADDNYFGTNSDARIISLLDGNDKVCDGGLIIDERAALDGKEYITELLRIRDSEFKWKGSNILHSGNSNINGSTITINGSSITVSKSDHTHNIYAVNENYGGFKKAGRLPTSGFYQSNESESDGNAPWSGWMHLINCLHNNTDNNYALLIAASFSDNNTFKIRVTNNNVNNAWRDIIHSGNIGSLLVKGAYMTPLILNIKKLISSGYLASDYTNRRDTVEYMKASAKYLLKNYPGYSVFGTMVPNALGFFTAYIYNSGFNSNGNPEHITIHYYPHGGNIINCGTTYGSWYYNTINKDGSSYKLQTARKIWGQSFDGTADISGTLSGVANILFNANNTYDIGSNNAASRNIYTHWLGAKSGLKLELGANNSGYGLGLCINTNLNVGIGTNSPAYKLHVNGTFRATNSTISDLFVNTGDATLKIYTGRTADALNDGNICFLTSIDGTDGQSHAHPTLFLNRCNIVLQPRGGLVYIGTNPGTGNTTYKLYVNSKIFSNGGFVKNGSSDAYVLLGGGGHKPLSEFLLGSGSYLPYNGWWDNGNGLDVNDANGMIFAYATHKNSPFSSAWGIITTFDYTYNSDYKFLLAANGYSNAMYYRSRSNDRGGWTSWALVIDTENIGSQSVAYATSAGSVAWSNITGKPSSLKNPYSLTTFGVSYDGSAAKTVTTSNFISLLGEGTSTVTDGTMFITSYASDSGFADTNAVNVPYKRKASCLWSYIDSKVSSKYLPLAGGTMNGNARIGHGSGNLYIGNSGNDGWIYTQDIASLKGTDKWSIRESGAAHFGFIHIASTNDNSLNRDLIESDSGYGIHLNYFNNGNVTLCNGGGNVGIGTSSPTYKLDVRGSVSSTGFIHSSHNSNDAVLLAGGGYSQGVPVRYWAIYSMYIGSGPNDISYIKRSGNHNFITSYDWLSEGCATLKINFPSGYSKNNTLIFGNGDHQISHNFGTPVYVTIITDTDFGSASQIRVLLSNDSSLDTGYANIYFMCMG